ncbi:MAG: amidohydrolase/deacetylase family metallohydrolase [Chloroflexota bacterium]|jgi:dihydroorotase
MTHDLVIHGGSLIDPGSHGHARLDLAIGHGRVTDVAPAIGTSGALDSFDASGLLVVPGLVDLHVHVYWGGADLSVEPGPHDLARGVTTMVDAGSSGANNFPAFRRFIMEPFAGTILAFLNIAVMGQADPDLGELHDIRYAKVDRAIEVARANPDRVVGLKVRVSEQLAGRNGVEAVRLAREAGTAIGRPVMVHIGGSTAPIEEILALLGPGDIVTHAFTGWEPGLVDTTQRVIPAAREARARGVLFDVGHGRGSFAFGRAEAALADGFRPDTISTDLHRFNVPTPVTDLTTTMSKFLYLGLPLEEVVAATTATPAAAIGRSGAVGTLRVGATADVTVLRLEEGSFVLEDSYGATVTARQRLVSVATFVAGRRVA